MVELDRFVQTCMEGRVSQVMGYVLGTANLIAMRKTSLKGLRTQREDEQSLLTMMERAEDLSDVGVLDLAADDAEKPSDPAIRPIAIGDMWRRLVGKKG